MVYLWQDHPRARVWTKDTEPIDLDGPDEVIELPRLGLRLPLGERTRACADPAIRP